MNKILDTLNNVCYTDSVINERIYMKDVYELNSEQFMQELSARTTPALIINNANTIYDYLAELFNQPCADSVLREWAFQWASDRTQIDYDVIFNEWLRR